VLAALPGIVTMLSGDGSTVLFQNTSSVAFMGLRCTAMPDVDDVAGDPDLRAADAARSSTTTAAATSTVAAAVTATAAHHNHRHLRSIAPSPLSLPPSSGSLMGPKGIDRPRSAAQMLSSACGVDLSSGFVAVSSTRLAANYFDDGRLIQTLNSYKQSGAGGLASRLSHVGASEAVMSRSGAAARGEERRPAASSGGGGLLQELFSMASEGLYEQLQGQVGRVTCSPLSSSGLGVKTTI
jgi:hypothetical protein